MKRSAWMTLVVLAVGLSLLLGVANLFLGNLNQDEGWYLYAAQQVAAGKMLYRDFMFTQGPVMPVVYSFLFPIVGKFGVAGGRLITMLFGLGAAGCAAWLAARSVSKHWKSAAFCAFVLVGVNVYHSYFTTIVKTYALTSFFLTAGFVALSYVNGRRGASAAFWGGFLLGLAACTRLSAGVALPIAGVWLICNRKTVFPGSWVAFGLGGGFVLAVALGSCFLLAPENTHFALFGYHAGREPGGLVELIALKGGFVSRFVQGYFLFTVGCVGAFIFRRHQRHVREAAAMVCDVRPRLTELLQQANHGESPFAHALVSLLWMSGIAVTLVHFTAPFPYDDYQVFVFPVLAAALAATLIPRVPEKNQVHVLWTVLLVSAAASFSSPVNQEWMVRGRDRIWWNFKETSDLAGLRQAGKQVRETLGKNDLLLTQDTYLAVEAGAQVPHGLEMGPFSYYPEMLREEAERLNLLNKEMMLELLVSAEAPVAAFSGYGLTIESPSIGKISSDHWNELRSALEKRYALSGNVEYFGQAHTLLEIFERK